MKSIKYLYKTGYGPSSSHTMVPEIACERFIKETPDADFYKVILYGSLSKTGNGHGTDTVIKKCFVPSPVEIIFDNTTQELPHPNTMDILTYSAQTKIA